MPSPEEFAGSTAHGVGAAPRLADGRPDMEALKRRAREVREAQARRAPIPGTGAGVLAAAPVQPAWGPPQPEPVQESYSTPAQLADRELEEVRTRFKLASYYEALLEQPAFGDDVNTDPYAAQVQTELTDWVKGRMSELVGIRNNPEGFQDDEVQLLRSLAQQLGANGVLALVSLADRMLNPPPRLAVSRDLPGVEGRPGQLAPVEEDDDQGSSAMSLSAAPAAAPPAPPPASPQVAPVKAKRPYVRRAKVPGAPVAAQATSPAAAPPVEEPSQRRGRKRSSDPLAAGKAAVASAAQGETAAAPAAAPAPGATVPQPSTAVQPMPMPRGLGMTMAMEQKAGEALRDAKVIAATGGGVL